MKTPARLATHRGKPTLNKDTIPMTVAKSNTRLSPVRMKGKRLTDGFKPEDFRDTRLRHRMTLREVEVISGLPRATISAIERGKCLNPEGRRLLAEAYSMKHEPKAVSAPPPVSAPVSGAFEELADWLLAHSTDELVLARLRYEKLLAARVKG